MHKSKFKRIALAVCIAFLPFSAHSAGLGKLTVISGLGEPLRAEIDLVSTTPEELASLTASIAPQEAYAVQGIERQSIHNAIKIDLVKKPNGSASLKLTTLQPVVDPFLDMLIQVDWATGRLLREYTVLLDPPGYKEGEGSVVYNVPSTAEQAAAPVAAKTAASSSPAPASVAPSETKEKKEYITKSGDTLNKIARDMQVQGHSLDQMLVALYQSNRQAFEGENMNRLKVGQIIKAPSNEVLSSVSQQEAAKEIRVQTADWNAYRNRLAGIVAESAPTAEDAGDQAVAGKLKAATEDKAAVKDAGPKDVVKLSKSEAATVAAESADVRALQEKINALQEENIARQETVSEASERVTMLEKQIADLQALITIKDKTLAGLQKNATTLPEPAVKTPAQDENGAAANVVADTKPVKEISAAAEAAQPGIIDNLTDKWAGNLDDFADNSSLLGLAGGALVLLGGGWLLIRNRRKKNLDSFEQGILTAGGLKANTVFGNTSGATVDTGDTSFLTNFSQNPSGMIDTHDVDPIAEAEVYMAYGRDSQAEEILNDAISKEPTRYELHLKLLEIFASRNDPSAFEAVAGELYSTLGASNPVWTKVAEMGQMLEPTNPLYDLSNVNIAASGDASPISGASAAQDMPHSDSAAFGNTALLTNEGSDFAVAKSTDGDVKKPAVAESSFDFDLGFESNQADGESRSLGNESPTTNMLQFDASAMNADVKPTAKVDEVGKLDFNMEFAEKAQVSDQNSDPATAGKYESSASVKTLQFGVSGFSETVPGQDVTDINTTETAAHQPVPSGDADSRSKLASTLSFEAEPADADKDDSSGLDFNFDLDDSFVGNAVETDALSTAKEVVANGPEMDLSGISLDMNMPENSVKADVASVSEQESEEVSTKLDLVTAYIDMGDNEGARELIEEVLKEGSVRQRARAQALLSSLS